ncbi:MAG: hypothetical protein CFE33_15985 [Pseudorhodobacter sp. PARRP1]|nr:MAG: hypothetical protein CFE33_15985 [Pseudorhodobacter sp. PARRP1]
MLWHFDRFASVTDSHGDSALRAQYALAAEAILYRSRHGCAGFKHGKIMAAIWPNNLVKMA